MKRTMSNLCIDDDVNKHAGVEQMRSSFMTN